MLLLLLLAVMGGLTVILKLSAADPQLTKKLALFHASLDPVSSSHCSWGTANPSPVMNLELLQFF